MKNSSQIALMYADLRSQTDEVTGFVAGAVGVRAFGPSAVTFSGFGFVNLLLGNERPIYEILYRDHVYRMLCRPSALNHGDSFELIRSRAPGFKVDGILLEPPEFLPNTPTALFSELIVLTGSTHEELVNEAYDILGYREKHKGSYPESAVPKGYLLGSRSLIENVESGGVKSLYATPTGTNPDLWTLFLYGLDLDIGQKMIDYAFSGLAQRELGQSGRLAAIRAIKLRYGDGTKPWTEKVKGLVDLIPNSRNKLVTGRVAGIRPLTES